MPGPEAAIGANPYLYLVAERIARPEFGAGAPHEFAVFWRSK
jgi:hypothetical protein